jgi:hypothetical protein
MSDDKPQEITIDVPKPDADFVDELLGTDTEEVKGTIEPKDE